MRGVRRRAAAGPGTGRVIWLARWPRGSDTCGRMDGRDGQEARTLGAPPHRLALRLLPLQHQVWLARRRKERGRRIGTAHGAHVIGRAAPTVTLSHPSPSPSPSGRRARHTHVMCAHAPLPLPRGLAHWHCHRCSRCSRRASAAAASQISSGLASDTG